MWFVEGNKQRRAVSVMFCSRKEVTSETQRRKTVTILVNTILVNTIHNFTSKIWSPVAGFWASLRSWVWMFLRLRIALGGTGLSTCLHLVAPFSSKWPRLFHGANLQVEQQLLLLWSSAASQK